MSIEIHYYLTLYQLNLLLYDFETLCIILSIITLKEIYIFSGLVFQAQITVFPLTNASYLCLFHAFDKQTL